MDSASLYRELRWACDPAHAVVCCVCDVHSMTRVHAGVHTLALFRHLGWPCAYVIIVGLVVAAAGSDTRCVYTVDDGTASIDVACELEEYVACTAGVDPCYVPRQLVRRQPQPVGAFVRALGRIGGTERYISAVYVHSVSVNDEIVHARAARTLAEQLYASAPVELVGASARAREPSAPHSPTVGSFVTILRKHLDTLPNTRVTLDALAEDVYLSQYARRVVASKLAHGAAHGRSTQRLVRRVFAHALGYLERHGYLAADAGTHEYTIQS